MKNVLTLIGGISRDSLNQRLYRELSANNPTALAFQTFDLASLPFFSQDLEATPPETVVRFRQMVNEADAVLLITPEYNRSYPAVLKNALDWASRPTGENLWRHKPAAIAGASSGKIGTFGAQQHLRNVCSFLDMKLMSQPEFYFDASSAIDKEGNVTPSSISFIQKFLAAFEAWIG